MADNTTVETKVEDKPEAKPEEAKVEAKPEAKVDEAKPEAKPESKAPDWRDDRLKVLTAKLRAAEAEALAAKQKTTGAVAPTLTEDEVNRRAEALAVAKAN